MGENRQISHAEFQIVSVDNLSSGRQNTMAMWPVHRV